jgi:hypothetical protein
MRTNLNEEIQKNLRLMGILNEAASPSKGIFKLLVGSLLGNSLDTAIAKIEAKTGKTFAGKGIKAFEDAEKTVSSKKGTVPKSTGSRSYGKYKYTP